ncbi:MAG: HNH endonuclease [Thiomicrorhabdus sp.]|nr:HNH endonuclease [Thiomicrorhabdus sp.]
MEQIIKEYPAYKITDTGDIYSSFKYKTSIVINDWRIVKQIYDKSCGYNIVTLCDGNGKRQNKRVHRLLLEAFKPNPEDKVQVNHIDGNKLNNSLDNLEWATASENAIHAISTGLCDDRRKAQEVVVVQLDVEYNIVAEHVSIHQAGRDTGIAWQNISKVVRELRHTAGGFRWKYKQHVTTIP